MKTLKILAIGALCTALAASMAVAGTTCTKSSAAGAQAAGTGCGGSAAAVQTAGTSSGAGCSHAATTAASTGAACAKGAAMTAAGMSCHSAKAAKVAAADVEMETVKLPSGMMAVLYTGKTPEARAHLAEAAKSGCASSFACPITREMAAKDHCSFEVAATSSGVMVLVKADSQQTIDEYAKKFEVAMTEAHTAEQGE